MAILLSTGADLGNQELLNFKIENGETFNATSNSYKQPYEGRMIYDKNEHVLRFGYKDSHDTLLWGTLLTTGNFDTSAFAAKVNGELVTPTMYSNHNGDASRNGSSVILREQSKMGKPNNAEQFPRACFGVGDNMNGNVWFDGLRFNFTLNGFTSLAGINAGRSTFDKVAIVNGISSQFLKADGSLDSNVYTFWMPYTKEAVSVELVSFTPTTPVNQVVFNTNGTAGFVREHISSDGTKRYVKAVDTDVVYSTITVANYNVRGCCISVDGNIYRYDGKVWSRVHSGGGDYSERIKAIEDALLLDEDKDDVINTWKEVQDFLATIDNRQDLASHLAKMKQDISSKASSAEVSALQTSIDSKADKNDVLTKPVTEGNEHDMLFLERSQTDQTLIPAWKTTKIVDVNLTDDLENKIKNHEWVIDIEALNTDDVTVSIFRAVKSNKWEMVLADVYIDKYEDVDGLSKRCVRIVFGDEGNYTYKAIITA